MPTATDTSTIQARLFFFAFVMVGCGLTFFFSSILGWALLAAVSFAVMLLGNPRVLLMFYAVWITIMPYLDKVLGGGIVVKWLDESLLVAMLATLLFNTRQHRRRPELVWVNRSLVTLACLIAISAMVNQVSAMQTLHFCLQYMRWYVIFYAGVIFVGAGGTSVLWKGLMGLYLLQVVLNVGWQLGVNPMPNWMSGPDLAIGTGLSAAIVGYFSVAFACLAMGRMSHGRGLRDSWIGMLMLVVALYQLYTSYTVHAYLLGGICIVITLIQSGSLIRHARLLGWVLVSGSLVVSVAFTFSSQLSSEFVAPLTPEYVAIRWNNMVAGPKGQAYHDTVLELPDQIPFPLIGAGPGNAGSNVAMQNRTYLADRFFNWVLLSSAAEYQRLSEGSSITSGPHTGILAILSELGPLGLLAYYGIHWYAMMRVWRQVRRRLYLDRTQRILAEAFVATMWLICALVWIVDIWYYAFLSNGIWIWAAIVWIPRESTPEGGSSPVAAGT